MPTPSHQGRRTPDDTGEEKLLGLLRAGDPKGDVTTVWHAKEAVRELYAHNDPELALEWVERSVVDIQDKDYPIEARSLGRTLIRWKHQIAAWHKAQVTNGPTEAVNNSDQAREAGGVRVHSVSELPDQVAALRRKDWDLLATITPVEIRSTIKMTQ